MDSAKPFYRENLPFFENFLCPGNGLFSFCQYVSLCIQENSSRPAHGTCIRLCMISSVFNVMIFRIAIRTHGETAHGGLYPVIRHIFYNRKTGPAVGTIDERIMIPPVAGSLKFSQAVITDTNIRRNQRISNRFLLTVCNFKSCKTRTGQPILCLDVLNHSQAGSPLGNLCNKTLQNTFFPVKLKLDPGGSIPNGSIQAILPNKPMNKRPESYPLHDTVNFYEGSFHSAPLSGSQSQPFRAFFC